jgi:trk system potassium uptake protein
MFVLVAGGGRTGTQLAARLLEHNHIVRLIEHRRDILTRAHHELPTEVIYEGNALDPQSLEQAGIRQAQVFTACTPNDADNLVLCYLARTQYQVPRTIARINNTHNAWLFDQKFHVDMALNQVGILASLILEEMSLGDMITLLKLHRGQYSLVEERIPVGSRVAGIALKDLTLPENCVIAAIIRQGEMVVPRGITTFEIDDEVLAITDSEGAQQLAKLLGPQSVNGLHPGS